ncbi:MAG: efflux RND transporter periplasmic adaptor subunit [Candidatus Paceibacterota bacterium]
MRKITLVILIIILIGAGIGYQFFLGNSEEDLTTVKAKRDNITERVSVTGSLVPLKRIKLQPKVKGQVEEVSVEISDEVEKEESLITLEQDQVKTEVRKSKTNVESVNQEISLLETKLKNAEKNLEQTENTTTKSIETAQADLKAKKQNLKDVEQTEQDNLKNVYENGRTALDVNYLTVNKARIELDNIQDDYFNGNDQISLKVKDKLKKAKSTLNEAKILINEADSTEDRTTTKNALNRLKEGSNELKEALRYTRDEACEDPRYEYEISDSTKTDLDTQKTNVEDAISNLTTARQNIKSQEITSQRKINTAQSQLESAQAALEEAESQQEQKITQAESKIEELKQEISLKKTALETAKSNLEQARQNLKDTTITAPFSGTVTKVEIEEGETASPGQIVIVMIPEKKYKIEADISEVNITSIEKEDPIKVDFDALPGKEYEGEVIKIHPDEIVKEGVIYYRIEAVLDHYPQQLKPGFTTNLDIITGQKENTVTVPYIAVQEDDQGDYVQVLKNNEVKKRRVEVGLEGDTKIEITEGLEAGEEVVLSR